MKKKVELSKVQKASSRPVSRYAGPLSQSGVSHRPAEDLSSLNYSHLKMPKGVGSAYAASKRFDSEIMPPSTKQYSTNI